MLWLCPIQIHGLEADHIALFGGAPSSCSAALAPGVWGTPEAVRCAFVDQIQRTPTFSGTVARFPLEVPAARPLLPSSLERRQRHFVLVDTLPFRVFTSLREESGPHHKCGPHRSRPGWSERNPGRVRKNLSYISVSCDWLNLRG